MLEKDNIKENLLIISLTKNDIKVTIAVDYDNDTVSLVTYDSFKHSIENKKYIFAECGTAREKLWLEVLDAQQAAIKEGMRLLKEFNKKHRKLPF